MAQHIWVESPITHDDITFIDNDQMETTDSPWDTSSTTAKPQPPPPTPHSSMMAAEWLVFNPNPGPQSAPWFSASEQDLFRNTEEVMDTFDVVLHRPVRPKLHINALPNEVLGEVFDLYTHSVESSYTPGRYGAVSVSRDKPNNPTILGRVCSRWRTLSHLTAKLWSKIAVISPCVKDVRILKHWLERSASRPLDITIVQRYPTRDMDIAIQSIFHLVLGENKRLRSISLDLCFNIERHLLCRTHIPLPRLTQFQLDLPGWSASSLNQLANWFYRSPQLTSVHFGPSTACATVLQNAPWQRLHSVTLNDLEQANLPALFSVCEDVQSLTIHRLEGPAGFQSPVCLPRLRELALGYASDLSTIFNNLSLPALQTLRIPTGFGNACTSQSGWTALHELLVRSGCHLKSFTCSLHERVLPLVLASPTMANLEELTIYSTITDSVLTDLTHTGSSRILPSLKEMTFMNVEARDGVLSSMILSRSGRTPLRYVYAELHGHGYVHDSMLQVPGVELHLVNQYLC